MKTYKKQKRLKQKFIFAIIPLIILSVALINSAMNNENKININNHNDTPILSGAYEVVRVVDGDTIVVSIDNVDTTIRLIGVNAPESVHPDKSKNTIEGKTSSDFLKEYLKNKDVFLEYDIDKLDKYDRTLAYVYTDKNTMVQKVLLQNGLAEPFAVEPNVKYKSEFEKLN